MLFLKFFYFIKTFLYRSVIFQINQGQYLLIEFTLVWKFICIKSKLQIIDKKSISLKIEVYGVAI